MSTPARPSSAPASPRIQPHERSYQRRGRRGPAPRLPMHRRAAARPHARAQRRGRANCGLRVSATTTRFRPAADGDLPAVVEAYNAGIEDRLATFETEPRSVADLAGWLTDGQPFVVAECDGRVVGFARAGAYSDRCVYSGVGEHAVYVARDARGHGLGRQLLDA